MYRYQDFNHLVHLSRNYKNVAVLVGYEPHYKTFETASDIWLISTRTTRGIGYKGMTAAMNGAVNFCNDDGWIPELFSGNNNSWYDRDYANMTVHEQDQYILINL